MKSIAKTFDINIRIQDEDGQEYLLTYCKPVNVAIRQEQDNSIYTQSPLSGKRMCCPGSLHCYIDFEARANENGGVFTITKLDNKESTEDITPSDELAEFLKSFAVMKG